MLYLRMAITQHSVHIDPLAVVSMEETEVNVFDDDEEPVSMESMREMLLNRPRRRDRKALIINFGSGASHTVMDDDRAIAREIIVARQVVKGEG